MSSSTQRFVEVGRVVMITFGPCAGKLAVIVDIIDHARVLVDGPSTGVPRMSVSFKRCALTSIVVKIPRTIKTAGLTKALVKQDLDGMWQKTGWAKKLAVRELRTNLTDFDRFKLMVARKQVCVYFLVYYFSDVLLLARQESLC
jgi:large subunit ribosomal protein L14e